MTKKTRLDVHLLTKGLAESREKAQKLIRAGKVRDLAGNIFDKPGQQVLKDLDFKVESDPKFVSRGGEKLEAALDKFPIRISRQSLSRCRHLYRRLYGLFIAKRSISCVWD